MADPKDYIDLARKLAALRQASDFPQLFFPQQKSARQRPSDDAEVITLVLAALDKLGGSSFFDERNHP